MCAADTVAVMKIEGRFGQIPGRHAASRRIHAFNEMVTNRKAGPLLDHADPAMLFHAEMPAPIVGEFKRSLVLLPDRNSFLNTVTQGGACLKGSFGLNYGLNYPRI